MLHEDWQKYLETRPVAEAGQPAPSAAAGAWLTRLSLLRFRGPDARSFLQGYLTNDTGTLRGDQLQPTALCNLKGRVVVNGWCWAVDDTDVRLLIHGSVTERLAAFLRPYLMFAKTELEDETPNHLLFGLLSDSSDIARDLDGLGMGRRQIVLCDSTDDAAALSDHLSWIDESQWLASLIEDGIPLVTAATSETFLPQMLNLDASGAVSFSKGCYLGQEVVARAQHRGEVKRRLHRLTWSGEQALSAGQEITDGRGRAVGIVINAVLRHGEGQCLAVLQAGHVGDLRQGDTDLRSVA